MDCVSSHQQKKGERKRKKNSSEADTWVGVAYGIRRGREAGPGTGLSGDPSGRCGCTRSPTHWSHPDIVGMSNIAEHRPGWRGGLGSCHPRGSQDDRLAERGVRSRGVRPEGMGMEGDPCVRCVLTTTTSIPCGLGPETGWHG